MQTCVNNVENIIGPVDQSNSVTGNTPNTIHSNNIEVSQNIAANNDCDESVLAQELMMQNAISNFPQ